MSKGKNVFLGIIAVVVMFSVSVSFVSAVTQKRTGDAIYALANKEIKNLLTQAIANALKTNAELVASKKAYDDAKNEAVAGSAASILKADLAKVESAYTTAIAAATALPSGTPAEAAAKAAAFKKAENDKKTNKNSAQQKYNTAVSELKRRLDVDTKRITDTIKTAQELIFITGDTSKKKAVDTAYNTYKTAVEAARVTFRDAVKTALPSIAASLTE